MKKIIFFLIVFLLLSVFTVYSETSIRVGKTAVSAHLVYGKAGAQVYSQDEFGLTYTFLSGVEWQSPFKLLIAFEGGAEFENGDWGYVCGGVLGLRF
ncbi:MAG: hypothetical protein PF693_16965 [Spirochaetia bacterium]|jgi:hypothetical protein|nr:hypothetical protein [Spirochaetia bacterium]